MLNRFRARLSLRQKIVAILALYVLGIGAMLIVALSRFLAMPKYLNKLSVTDFSDLTVSVLTKVSFGIMIVALLIGAGIILSAMYKARRLESQA